MSIHLLILKVKTHCFHNSIQLEPPTVRAVVATLGECTNRTSNLLQWPIPFLRCQVPGVWKLCRKTQIFHVLSCKPCQYYFLFAASRYPTTLKPNECISQRNCHLQEWSCEQHWTYPQIRFNVCFLRLLDLQDKRPILIHQCKQAMLFWSCPFSWNPLRCHPWSRVKTEKCIPSTAVCCPHPLPKEFCMPHNT